MARQPAVEDRGLPVWHAKEGEGYWTPERGNVSVPDGWVFVPSGDAFVTREVKRGPHWVLLKRRTGYTATLGVFCPEASLTAAARRRDETAESRARQRMAGKASRERAETRYRAKLEKAIVDFLGFRPPYEGLALEIARGAAAQATPVGSGRVGRTRTRSLSQRAELAARAYLRHKYTDYEKHLDRHSLPPWDEVGEDDSRYREIKADAQRKVDRFLEEHRARDKPDKVSRPPTGHRTAGGTTRPTPTSVPAAPSGSSPLP